MRFIHISSIHFWDSFEKCCKYIPFAHLPKLLPTYLAISVSKQTDIWCCWHFKQLHWFSMRSIFYLCHCLPLTIEETTYISFCIPNDSDPNLVTFYAIFAMKRNNVQLAVSWFMILFHVFKTLNSLRFFWVSDDSNQIQFISLCSKTTQLTLYSFLTSKWFNSTHGFHFCG